MDRENFANSLHAFQRRKPFQPYVVHFIDGESILVEHPEAVRYQGMGTAVFFGKDGEITLFDHEGVTRIRNEVGVASASWERLSRSGFPGVNDDAR